MTPRFSEESDHDLVGRFGAGDEAALGALYDRHADALYALAHAILKDDADAEEAVEDAFLQLWRDKRFETSRGTVGAYLCVIVRSRALDRLRARRRRDKVEARAASESDAGFALPVAAAGPAPDRATELAQDRRRVVDGLSALPEKQRAVIGLAYFEGLSHSEIAERLSEPLGTVKTRLRDGMRRLREGLATKARNTS